MLGAVPLLGMGTINACNSKGKGIIITKWVQEQRIHIVVDLIKKCELSLTLFIFYFSDTF